MQPSIPETRPLRFALIGSAPSSIMQAPYHDPSWQVWGCSPGAYGAVPRGRSNIWWELHRYEPGQVWFSPEYCQFLRDHPCVAVSAERREIPNGFVPDMHAMIAKYGEFFWTSSIAWMMAYAIDMIEAAGNPPGCQIGLWGVDMAANEEYEGQRSGLHFFAHIAKQRGIEVGIPNTSDLFTRRFRYGFDEQTHSFVKMRARKAELEQRSLQCQQIISDKTQELAFVRGALDDLNYCFNTWADKSEYVEPPKLGIEFGSSVPAPVIAEGMVGSLPVDMAPGAIEYIDSAANVGQTLATFTKPNGAAGRPALP